MLKKRRRGVTIITPTVESLPVENNNEITDVAGAHFRPPLFIKAFVIVKYLLLKENVSQICFDVSKQKMVVCATVV